MRPESSLTAILLLALCASPLPLLLQRHGRGYAALAAVLVMSACLLLLAPLVPAVMQGGTLLAGFAWLPDWGLTLSFRLDGLGLMFSLLILGIGLLVTLYAYYYLPGGPRRHPLPNPLPQAGEGANESLRKFHAKQRLCSMWYSNSLR